jgi:hypothetical protein
MVSEGLGDELQSFWSTVHSALPSRPSVTHSRAGTIRLTQHSAGA